jgi:hypothetical protein
MRLRLRGTVLAACGLLAAAAPTFAHHSFAAEFQTDKEFTVTGTMTKVEWTNPHIYFYVDSKGDDGKITNWAFEGPPHGMLHRAGLTREMFKVGEVITVTGVPCKDGTKHMGYGKSFKYNSDGHQITMWVTDREQP